MYKKVAIVNNIITPYRVNLFQEISKIVRYSNLLDVTALFLSESESVRKWSIDKENFNFKYDVFKHLVQFRNPKTTTSDVILNYGYLRALKSYDVIVLFGYNYLTYVLILLSAKIRNQRTILFCETTVQDANSSDFKVWIKKKLVYNLFDTYLVPGKMSLDYLMYLGIERSRIGLAPNGIPAKILSKKISPSGNRVRLIFVGRLSPEKNIDFIFKAIDSPQWKDSDAICKYDISLTIVGNGPLEEDLRDAATGLPVDFRGFVAPYDLDEVLAEHDILVLPSHVEPWGFVVNEAISNGLAVLVSEKVGCWPELVRNNGHVYGHDSVEEFIYGLSQIVSNLSLAKNSSLKLSNHYTSRYQAECFIRMIRLSSKYCVVKGEI